MYQILCKYLVTMGYTQEVLDKYYTDCNALGHEDVNIIKLMEDFLSQELRSQYENEIITLQQAVTQPVQQEVAQQVQLEVVQQEVVQQVQQEVVQQEVVQQPNEELTKRIEASNTKASIEKEIQRLIYEMSILDKEIETGPHKNDNHFNCPSFNNLIPEVQNLIIRKRDASINKMWFEKYRPELMEEILFPNQAIAETINGYVKAGRIGGHCMFYGSGGVGKTTTNIVLMNAILKHANDRFYLDRKVEDIDKLKTWLQHKPMGSQKIVIAEEFDRLSDSAQTELKNGLLEKYDNVIFLASTNKIHKIDTALLSRFTFIAQFDKSQFEDLYKKLKYILVNERIAHTDEDLKKFTDLNLVKGIRTILNNLQLSCNDGIFYPDRTSYFVGNSGTEFDLITVVKNYINYLISLDVNLLNWLEYSLEYDKTVKEFRDYLFNSTTTNYSLNWDYVFMELMGQQLFLPSKNIIQDYYQRIDLVKIKSLHFEAMLNDILIAIKNSKIVKA